MTGHVSYQLSVMFAAMVGTAGSVLALQAWLKFKGTPFGRVLSVLPPMMVIIAMYHPLLLIFPGSVEIILLIETAGFGLLLLFAVLSIRFHRRMVRGRAV